MKAADGVIVSSSLKRHGRIEEPIDPIRVSQFVESMRRSLSLKNQPERERSKEGEANHPDAKPKKVHS
jgi:hypothetical protein